jgi:hypothetical protein
MNRPLRIGPDGIVEFATSREVAHLNHCLEDSPTPEVSDSLYHAVGKTRVKKRKRADVTLRRVSDLPLATFLGYQPRPRLPLKNCPFCNCQVREERMQGHLVSRCPLRPSCAKRAEIAVTLQLKTSRPIPKPSHSMGRPSEDSAELMRIKPEDGEAGRPEWTNNLDATKNCGYPAREEGRYGSYPSHDGFDDESKP